MFCVVWCVTGDNYWGNRFYLNVDVLFWKYAVEAAEFIEEHHQNDKPKQGDGVSEPKVQGLKYV